MRKKSLVLTLMLAFSCLLGGGDLMGQKPLPYSYGFENNNLAVEGWTTNNCFASTGINTYPKCNGTYIFDFYDNKDATQSQYLISPLLSNANFLYISFYIRKNYGANCTYRVGYTTSDDVFVAGNYTWINGEALPGSYSLVEYELNAAGIKHIAIECNHSTTNGTYFMAIDDVTISGPIQCPKPSLSSTVLVTSKTAKITWTPGDADQELFDIYWNTLSTAPTAGTIPSEPNYEDSGDHTYTITGLDANTTYYVWIRGNCGTDVTPIIDGGWTSSVSFKTENDISIPYICGIESTSSYMPTDWKKVSGTSSYPAYASNNQHSGSKCLRFNGNTSSTKQIVALPELNRELNGLTIVLYAKQVSGYNDNNLQIGYITDRDNANTFVSIGTHTVNLTNYDKFTTKFSGIEGDPRYIAISYNSTGNYNLYIDDIAIYAESSIIDEDGTWSSLIGEGTTAVINSNVTVGANTIADDIVVIGGTLTIQNGYSLSVSDISLNGGNVEIADNAILSCTELFAGSTTSNLIMKNGGQLDYGSSVALTFEKSIEPATKNAGDHWYTISSPVCDGTSSTISISNITNLTANNYDMFYYNEPNYTWINQKTTGDDSGFSSLTRGKGYLYRNTGNDISFPGNTYTNNNVTYSLQYTNDIAIENLKGFNLIGNPYTHNLYKGSGNVGIPNQGKLATGFYYLDDDGGWQTGTDNSTPIKPGQGILVKSTTAGSLYIYNRTGSAKAYNNNIKFIVSNNQYEDATYAWFDDGVGLNKIDHPNENVPMLYIPQNGHNYAIAIMEDNVETFGLNLKAMTVGKYTLSYKATGDFSYLHVIDRLTGEDVDMLIDGEYSFVASPSDNDNRFIVRLSYNGGSAVDSDNFAYQSGNDIIVSGEGELQVFDVTGRKVMNTAINGVETISGLSRGIYIFRVIGETQKTQKIVVR